MLGGQAGQAAHVLADLRQVEPLEVLVIQPVKVRANEFLVHVRAQRPQFLD
jgi:hypothetical protein